jgi:hypothetical protein
MDSNTHSTSHSAGAPAGLGALAAVVDELVDQDLDRLGDAALAEQVFQVRRQLDRLEGRWLRTLAAVDARGAAGAEEGVQAGSTAGWLRARLRMSAGAAASCVRTARALYRGPLTATAQALTDGAISPAHASVLAHDTHDLTAHLAAEAEPVLLEAARRLDPPRLRRVIGHLRLVADPDGADAALSAAGGVAGVDLGGHGRRQRPAGPRGRPDPTGRPGAPDPPHQRRRHPLGWSAPR